MPDQIPLMPIAEAKTQLQVAIIRNRCQLLGLNVASESVRRFHKRFEDLTAEERSRFIGQLRDERERTKQKSGPAQTATRSLGLTAVLPVESRRS